MNIGENALIRVLPACLKDPLPRGWDRKLEGYVIETMPTVDHPAAVPLSLTTTEPDILLVDGDFPNLDLAALTHAAHQARPGVAVIAFATDHSHEIVHRALLAGVEDFLTKPLDAAQLHDVLLSVASRRTLRPVAQVAESTNAPLKQGRVVGVVSGKGGLGKTTVATNLAALLAKSKQNTGLVGFESGDGAVLLSLQPKLGLLDMIAALANRETSDEESVFSADWMQQYASFHRSGLQYWTWKGNSTAGNNEVPDHFIESFTESCRTSFDYTFVDFPALEEDEFAALLPLLDVVLVVSSTCDLLALRSTKNLLDTVTPEFRRRVRLIINRADPLDMLSKEDFEEALNFRAAAALPNMPQIAASAINLGAPFALAQYSTELSDALKNLSEQLFKVPHQEEEPDPRPGKLFSWLKP